MRSQRVPRQPTAGQPRPVISAPGSVGLDRRRLAGLLLCVCLVTQTIACGEGTAADPEPDESLPLFTDVTAELGIPTDAAPWPDGTFSLPEIVTGGTALFDYDGDGDLDLLQVHGPPPGEAGGRAANRLYEQRPDGTFADVTEASGVGVPGHGQGVACGDVDDDGDVDLYFTNFGPDTFLRNQGDGTFTDATVAAGFGGDGWSVSAAFSDYDRDGDLDLYVVRYVVFDPQQRCLSLNSVEEYCGPQMFEPALDSLYRNEGDGTFVDVTSAAGIRAAGRGLGLVCVDLTGDDLVDVYVANDGEENHLWVNRGDGTFAEEALLHGLAVNGAGEDEASMGIAVGDLDGDGRIDLHITHLRDETNTLYRAQRGGVYGDHTSLAGLSALTTPYTGFGCAFLDYDNDGDLDVAAVNGRVARGPPVPGYVGGEFWGLYAEPNLLIENVGQGRLRDTSARAGAFAERVDVSRGLAVGDLDGDGDLDIVVGAVSGNPRVYRNQDASGHHWLLVRAVTGRRDAIGAEIVVVAGPRRMLGLVLPGASYASSSDPRVHFGLGTVTHIDALEVEWPDGSRERFEVGAIDRLVTVRQGAGVGLR